MELRQLSYADDADPLVKRVVIRAVEGLSGRRRYVHLYEAWRKDVIGKSQSVFGKMLELINIGLAVEGEWPPSSLPQEPLVMIANHPYGIADGIAILALAEQLGRPFRILINDQLMKVPEIRPYALPISFEETREAVMLNMETRNEAVRLLKEGVTIVVFPAGGVATAPNGFGQAKDLPWKMFPAKLIQSAKANVIPVYFDGQNGRLFHLASQFSLTLRLSLLVREFFRMSGGSIQARIGEMIHWHDLSVIIDRKDLLTRLYEAVFSLSQLDHCVSNTSTSALTPA